MYSPEVQTRLANLRSKVTMGEQLSLDEMKEVVLLMRGDRKTSVASTPASKRAKAKALVKSADTLLGELDNL